MELYTKTSFKLSKLLTEEYSTSFSSASKLYSNEIVDYIYSIYGWVRIADEIVDTYKGKNCRNMLQEFHQETLDAIEHGFSTNPQVHSFAFTCNKYNIEPKLIDSFIWSMNFDIDFPSDPLARKIYKKYIHGSAEVVGLMCLKVFVENDRLLYKNLENGAKALGSAFQKVNFLRDLNNDTEILNRYYFPEMKDKKLTEDIKNEIVEDINKDFSVAKESIDLLPKNSKHAVMLAFNYYHELLKLLNDAGQEIIMNKRISVPKYKKLILLSEAYTRKLLS